MYTYRLRPGHRQSQGIAKLPRLDIQVIQHFHVIGDEADGSDHHRAREFFGLYIAQIIEDVWLEQNIGSSTQR